MSDFEKICEEMGAGFREAHEAKDIRLLNVGTNNPNEHHWRFRTKSGEIVNVSITKEIP